MRTRPLGRTGPAVSELGVGMWGAGGWSESDDSETLATLQAAIEAGITFFDSALQYGDGHSDALLGTLPASRSTIPRWSTAQGTVTACSASWFERTPGLPCSRRRRSRPRTGSGRRGRAIASTGCSRRRTFGAAWRQAFE